MEEKRKARQEMMDEDFDPRAVPSSRVKQVVTSSGSSSGSRARSKASTPSTPPRSSPSTSPSRPTSSPKLALHFAGKIYRTLDKPKGVTYSPDANFLGEPDEEVGEAQRESREQRRLDMEMDMMQQASARVPKRKRRILDSDEEDGDYKTSKTSNGLADPAKITPNKREPPIRRSSPDPFSRLLPTDSSRSSPPPQPFTSIFTTSKTSTPFLPSPLANLVALQSTLETTLLFHLANSGSAIASSATKTNDKGEATIRMPNLIDLAELGRSMSTSGKRFGEKELANLVWVWQGCGVGVDENVKMNEEEEEDDLTFEMNSNEAAGMGFIVTKTKTGTAKSIVWNYGIGISVAVKANPQLPKLELVGEANGLRSAPKSPSSVGRGRDGMSVVALWSQGKEARKEEFTRRLKDWARQCAEREAGSSSAAQGRLFPSRLPEIPRAPLPSLAQATPCVPGTTSPSPKRKATFDVFGPTIPVPNAGGSKAALVTSLLAGTKTSVPKKETKSATQRRKEMMERIRKKAEPPEGFIARSELMMGTSTSGKKSLKPDKDPAAAWKQEQADRLKRRSMLSRLGNVADGVWMLFDVGRRTSILLDEVSASIAKSSKISVSIDEAENSLELLSQLCPLFVYIKSVNRDDWLFMKGQIGLKEVKERIAQELQATS